MVNIFFVYQFIKLLTTPFEEWEAYKLGIIDEKGNVLKKRRSLKTQEERKAFTPFINLAKNVRKALLKVPGGKSKMASYAAALYLIKEHNVFNEDIVEEFDGFEYVDLKKLEDYVGEEIANVTTTVLDSPERAVVNKKAREKYKRSNRIRRRKRKKDDTDV